jgi:heat shock protein HslJ
MREKTFQKATIPTGRYRAATLALFVVLAITSCATTPKPAEKAPQTAQKTVPASSNGTASFGIAGKTWLLCGYATKGQFIPLEPEHGTTARVVFQADGTFSGTTGINVFSGKWVTKGRFANGRQGIAITIAEIDKKPAPNDIAARFEQDILADLSRAAAAKKEKDALSFLDGRGNVLIRFLFRSGESL